jgi:hypothetical protein
MRNFTNASIFDDTLPIADGQMEIGANVPLDQLREAMEDWFRRKSYLSKTSALSLEEVTNLPESNRTIIPPASNLSNRD